MKRKPSTTSSSCRWMCFLRILSFVSRVADEKLWGYRFFPSVESVYDTSAKIDTFYPWKTIYPRTRKKNLFFRVRESCELIEYDIIIEMQDIQFRRHRRAKQHEKKKLFINYVQTVNFRNVSWIFDDTSYNIFLFFQLIPQIQRWSSDRSVFLFFLC